MQSAKNPSTNLHRVCFAAVLVLLGSSLLLLGQNQFRCTVTVDTNTTIQAVGGDCAARTSGIKHYITGITASSSAAAGTAADSMMTLKYGTGTVCGTGTTIFWLALQGANTTVVDRFLTPIRIPGGNDICWINSTAGTKTWVITGYLAP